MIRRILILSVMLICAGFVPALAQDLFLRSDGAAKSDAEQPTLYVKPQKSSLPEDTAQYAVKYADKLKVQQQKNKTKIIISSFDEMQEIGFKPRDAEEIGYYAQMHTAVAQNVMYKRREKLIAFLEKQERQAQEKIARQDKALKAKDPKPVVAKPPVYEDSEGKRGASKTGRSGSKTSSSDGTGAKKDAKTKKAKIYVEPSADEKAKPTKVFQDY